MVAPIRVNLTRHGQGWPPGAARLGRTGLSTHAHGFNSRRLHLPIVAAWRLCAIRFVAFQWPAFHNAAGRAARWAERKLSCVASPIAASAAGLQRR